MKKNRFQWLIALVFVGLGLAACSSSSKHTPDFRGVYETDLSVPYYKLDYKARLSLRPSATNDPYQMDAYLVVITKGDKGTALEAVPLVISAQDATDDTFSFKGLKKDFDFKKLGVGDLVVKGKVVDKVLDAELELKLPHKPSEQNILGTLKGYKTGVKESSVAKLNKVTCNDPKVLNIEIDHDKKSVTVYVDRNITEDELKELHLEIKTMEGGSYQINTEVLEFGGDMKITVTSQDGKNQKVYDVVVKYDQLP